MVLSWKDILATFGAIIIFGIYFSINQGIDFIFISGFREGIIATSLIGTVMCIATGSDYKILKAKSQIFFKALSFLGFSTFIIAIYGLLVGTQVAFISVSILVLLMWMLTTFHNLIFR